MHTANNYQEYFQNLMKKFLSVRIQFYLEFIILKIQTIITVISAVSDVAVAMYNFSLGLTGLKSY